MTDYSKLNDYELINMAQEYNEEAKNILYKKYKPLMIKKSKKIYQYLKNKGIELSDLIQECTIGFEEAIESFNQKDDVTFYTFANICMDRQLMSEATKLNRDKHKLLNEAIPLETLDEDENTNNLIDFLQNETNNPELDLLYNEGYQELYKSIISNLTPLESKVLSLKMDNYTYKEIANILEITEKSVDNSIQRIRAKVEKIIMDKKSN